MNKVEGEGCFLQTGLQHRWQTHFTPFTPACSPTLVTHSVQLCSNGRQSPRTLMEWPTPLLTLALQDLALLQALATTPVPPTCIHLSHLSHSYAEFAVQCSGTEKRSTCPHTWGMTSRSGHGAGWCIRSHGDDAFLLRASSASSSSRLSVLRSCAHTRSTR